MRVPLPSAVTGNQLLDRLGSTERGRVLSGCERVHLARGEIVGIPGEAMRHACFPTGSVISSLLRMAPGHGIEVAQTGHEGVYGAEAGRGSRVSLVTAEVQVAGGAWRMPLGRFRSAVGQGSALGALVDRYMAARVAQLSRAAGCNRFHSVEQRAARWLLMTADRARATTFPVTHEQLAATLGVRRVGVTNAAGELQRLHSISYARGVVTILDRRSLQRASCNCYRADLEVYERSLPRRWRAEPPD